MELESPDREQLKVSLKKYVENVTNSSVKVQRTVTSSLLCALKGGPALSDQIIRGLVRVSVVTCFTRLHNPDSYALIQDLIMSLAEKNPRLVHMALNESYLSFFNMDKIPLSKWSAKRAAIAGKWLILVNENTKSEQKTELFLSTVSGLCAIAFFVTERPLTTSGFRKRFGKFCTASIIKELVSTLKRMYASSELDAEKILALLCIIPKEMYSSELITLFISIFSNNILLGKRLPTPHIMTSCSDLFKNINYTQFQSILSVAKKAFLRNTEIAVFGKKTVGPLTSLNKDIRICVSNTVGNISKNLSNLDAICFLMKAVFDAYTGGKMSNPEQRISVIQAVSKLANHHDFDKETENIIGHLVLKRALSLVSSEGNETILNEIWHTILMFLLKMSDVSEEVVPTFKRSLDNASSRPVVLRVMVSVFSKHGYNKFDSELAKAVLAIQKSANSSSSEFITSSLLLLKCDDEYMRKEAWKEAVSNNVFFKERFLVGLDEKDAPFLSEFAEMVLFNQVYSIHEDESWKVLLLCMCITLFWPKHRIRNCAMLSLERVIAHDGLQFGDKFLRYLYDYVVSGIGDKHYRRLSKKHDGSNNENMEYVPGKLLSNVVKKILSCFQVARSNDDRDIAREVYNEGDFKESSEDECRLQFEFITSSLLVCSLPRIASCCGSLWSHWLQSVRDYEKLFNKNEKLIKELVGNIILTENAEVRENAIKLLMSAGGVALHFRKVLWEACTKLLREVNLQCYTGITSRDYAIYMTPEGELYNKDVIDQNSDEVLDAKNVKRESKAYKYKEQLTEMQLRKELAEKRRIEGKLTKKQQEAVNAELQAERVTREELKKLHLDCKNYIGILQAAVEGNPRGSTEHVFLLYDVVIPLLHSPLVSYLAVNAYRSFRDATFEPSDDYLHELVLYASIRTLGAFSLEKEWCEEPLQLQCERVIAMLAAQCALLPLQAAVNEIDLCEKLVDDEKYFDEDTMSIEKLCFIFPLLDSILRNSSQLTALRLNAIKLISSALNKNFIKNDEVCMLPLEGMASLLLHLVSENSADICECSAEALQKLVTLINDCKSVVPSMISMFQLLLHALKSRSLGVRETVLTALSGQHDFYKLSFAIPQYESFVVLFKHRVFIACHDPEECCCKIAKCIWEEERLTLDILFLEKEGFFFIIFRSEKKRIFDDVVSEVEFIRKSASRSLVTFIENFPSECVSLISDAAKLYSDLNELRGSVFDEVGRMVTDVVDRWEERSAVCESLISIASFVPESAAMSFMKIIVPEGLSDRNDLCRELMCNAAIEIMKKHGAAKMDEMLPFLEKMLNSTSDAGKDDNLRQGLVVVLGTLAQHLDPDDEKVRGIVARLIETLSTPSERVQRAVSKCLPPLVPAIKEKAKELAASLSCLLVEADTYGERRGAAYGLAGLIKGLGMSAIPELELIKMLQRSLSNKKSPKHRQGALFALEMLCSTMGKLFEPYIVQVLPLLLVCFGDSDETVRSAADDAAKAMMSMLSAHGVKLILPSLLAALDEDSWRTKCASVELLGAMSHCAPKQLSGCLPNIVPKLLEVLTDSHSKVQKSGEKALKQISKVIRNPEILGISSHLLNGLVDPASKTTVCLQTIVNTKFIHYIDAASLALIMPIIKRAFTDRNTETRKMAAQIIANIYSLTDSKDMEPYLTDLVPGLQNSLVDPVPEIRTVAAKAFGALVSCSIGDTSVKLREQIVPWLKEKLVSDASSVDRSGAAQGLSEVLYALGEEQLKYAMPDIIKTTESLSVSPEVRDGYTLMYIYLPMVFGDKFVPYLPQVIPSILKALADENEYLRDSALKAGQRLIAMFCSHARKLLLPQLQAALFDDNWRIRFASVTLIGDFLFNISGVSGKMTSATAGEDDTMGMEGAGKAIIRQLGQSCRDRVLAGIYLTRSDVALTVRQAAGHVWKIVVDNTPRMLKEIMRTLFEMLLQCLSSNSEDRQQMAARCLGELVKKMGERILVDVLPVLDTGLKSSSIDQRLGVAIALHEIIENTTKDVVAIYSQQLVEPIRQVLHDSEAEVRKAAATTFSVYLQIVGISAFDEVVTPLLEMITLENEDNIISGLSEIMRQNNKQMLPYILPKLTRQPVNAKVLCAVASVAGDSLTSSLGRILEFLLDNCENEEDLQQSLRVVSSVTDRTGVTVIISTLLQRATLQKQSAAASLLYLFAQSTKVDIKAYSDEILPQTLLLYTSTNPSIIENAIGTLMCLSQSMDQKCQLASLGTLKKAVNALKTRAEDNAEIPGLCHSKGLQPLLSMLREGVLFGGVEVKEMAGETLGKLVSMSNLNSLKSHVVSITGPLIRVLGDRYPPSVKISILTTLIYLLDKVDILLKPFLPQLQSTFLKALQEPSSRKVRLYAGGALSRLMKIHHKPEPIITELVKLLNNAEDPGLIETTLVSLRAITNNVHVKLTNDVLELILNAAENHCGENSEDANLLAASALYGEALLWLNSFDDKFIKVLESSANIRLRYSYALALQHICSIDVQRMLDRYSYNLIRSVLISLMQCEKPFVASSGVRSTVYVLQSQSDIDLTLLVAYSRAANHPSNDVKRVVGIGMQHIAQRDFSFTELKAFVPNLVNGTKEKNSAVRIAFEQALIAVFKLNSDNSIYDSYLSSIEGAAHDVLAESHRSLQRTMKQMDSSLESICDFPVVP
uniref:TOG domain-containing protein n=1 Tax=Syphacia muris TaxID=451379 RepID=A0A0N5AWT6_9BILA